MRGETTRNSQASKISYVTVLYCQKVTYEPRHEKIGFRGFRPGLTQTGLYSHRKTLEA